MLHGSVRGPTAEQTGRGFEQRGNAQHFGIGAESADQLDADRQAVHTSYTRRHACTRHPHNAHQS